jgi:hypothetical protein
VIAPVFLAAAVSAVVVATATTTVAPPSKEGPWRQVGASTTSRPGKLAHFFRIAQSPGALAVVATSSSARPIRLTWFTYCEFESDDAATEQNQATVTGARRVSAFPHVLDGATLCNVSVTIRVARGRAAAAVFSH